MKKQVFISILLMLLPIMASADAVEIDGIYYNLVDKTKTAEVTNNPNGEDREYRGDIVIPNSVVYDGKTYSVTSIGDYAFRYDSGLNSVTIPNSVTSIGRLAFDDSGLTSVTIPNSVTSIGYSAFSNCSGLTSVTIPNSVTSIGYSAFSNCSGLTLVTISNSVTSIGDYAFENCSGLSSITIPNSVTNIGNFAFSNCSGLTSVTIPNSVTSIGGYAFICCGLTSVNIPNSVTSISDHAFRSCTGLTSVTIGSGVKKINPLTFSNCPELTTVYCYAEQVPHMSEDAFEGSYIDYVTLYVPASVVESYSTTAPWSGFEKVLAIGTDNPGGTETTPIGTVEIDGIYYNLPKARFAVVKSNPNKYTGDVVIPSSVVYDGKSFSVTSIGNSAFSNCSGLTSVTIPNCVTRIGDDAFYNCSGLTSMTIPNCVTKIGDYAFSYCSGLTSVTIPNSVTSIGDEAFYNCSGLTSVTIPNSVTSIGSWIGHTFSGCSSLTSVTIGSGVRNIYPLTFSNCPELTTVYCYAEQVPYTSEDAFKGSYIDYVTLYVPESAIESYNTTDPWSCFEKVLAIGTDNPGGTGTTPIGTVEIDGIYYNLFKGRIAVVKSNPYLYSGDVTIPSSVVYDDKTFIVTSIGDYAFAYCGLSLTSVTIPNSVTSIGDYAFRYDGGLNSVTIPNSVTSIGDEAFYNCSGLTSVTIPNSVTSIGDDAFGRCSGLTSVTIPNSVTSIGDNAFSGCNNLASVTIGNSVTTIGQEAFSRCSHLIEVFMGAETPVAIDDNCFSNRVNATLYVPTSSKVVYEAADYWKEFKQIVENNSVDDVSQMDNAIYLDYQEAYINGTVPLYVKMKNTMTPNGCSFKLILPIGMNLAKDEGGDVIYTLANRADKMNVTIQDHNDGTYDLALMPSTLTATITGNSNTIIKFMLEIPDNISTGDYLMRLTKSLIQSETNNMTIDYPQSDMVTILTVNDYRMGDVNGDDGITPSDAIMTLFYYFNVAQTGFNAKAADVTGDGKVTPADAIEMLYKFFGVDRSDNSRRRAQQTSKLNLMLDPQ